MLLLCHHPENPFSRIYAEEFTRSSEGVDGSFRRTRSKPRKPVLLKKNFISFHTLKKTLALSPSGRKGFLKRQQIYWLLIQTTFEWFFSWLSVSSPCLRNCCIWMFNGSLKQRCIEPVGVPLLLLSLKEPCLVELHRNYIETFCNNALFCIAEFTLHTFTEAITYTDCGFCVLGIVFCVCQFRLLWTE